MTKDIPANKTAVRKIAEDHADYTLKVMRPVFVEAFIHGAKHGEDWEAARRRMSNK